MQPDPNVEPGASAGEDDPARQAVRHANALLARLTASPQRRVLFIGHSLGGGVQKHIADLAALLADACHVFVASPGPGGTVALALRDPQDACTAYFALPAELTALSMLLQDIGVSRVHVHHLRGLPRRW